MSFTNSISHLSAQWIGAGAMAAAGLGAVPPAAAQVIQVQDDGGIVVQDGPAIVTGDGIEPLILESRDVGDGRGVTVHRGVTTIAVARPIATLGEVFAGAAREAGVDARLLHAVAWQESRFRQEAVSVKGAIGIMQLMPDTARTLGVDPRDAIQNIRGGARLLARLLRRYGGDLDLTLAAYNAGPGAVSRYGGVPPFAETRDYVARIKQFLSF